MTGYDPGSLEWVLNALTNVKIERVEILQADKLTRETTIKRVENQYQQKIVYEIPSLSNYLVEKGLTRRTNSPNKYLLELSKEGIAHVGYQKTYAPGKLCHHELAALMIEDKDIKENTGVTLLQPVNPIAREVYDFILVSGVIMTNKDLEASLELHGARVCGPTHQQLKEWGEAIIQDIGRQLFDKTILKKGRGLASVNVNELSPEEIQARIIETSINHGIDPASTLHSQVNGRSKISTLRRDYVARCLPNTRARESMLYDTTTLLGVIQDVWGIKQPRNQDLTREQRETSLKRYYAWANFSIEQNKPLTNVNETLEHYASQLQNALRTLA